MEIPKLICFDVGARNGLKDLAVLSQYISLYSFEPNIENDDDLKSTTVANYADFNLIHQGLYSSAGLHDFNLMENPSMSSMLKPNYEVLDEYFSGIKSFKKWRKQLQIVNTKKIETTTIDSILSNKNIDTIDYLKLDTQGTELEILKGARTSLLNAKVNVIKIEFAFIPFYVGQPTFTAIDTYLKDMGYKFITCDFRYDTVSPFIKDSEKPKWGIGGDAYYCVDFDQPQNAGKMLNIAIVLGGLGFLSNASHIFNLLHIRVDEQQKYFNKVRARETKDYLKFLLPPFLIHYFKKLSAR